MINFFISPSVSRVRIFRIFSIGTSKFGHFRIYRRLFTVSKKGIFEETATNHFRDKIYSKILLSICKIWEKIKNGKCFVRSARYLMPKVLIGFIYIVMGNILATSKKFIWSNPISYKSRNTITRKKLVVITGCDSGLGYSLSLKCNEWGFSVISGCLDTESGGAKALTDHCHVCDLDVTNSKNISACLQKVVNMTKDNEYELYAVVNNAGIMIFGEFEWYTEAQILQQVEVNMLGYFRIAKAFLPILRKYKGRLINVTSHCSLFNLPSLSVYGSTKAAVQSWSHGLRLEQAKYGVKVINFIPGSFVSQSNIMASQQSHLEEMERNLNPQEKQFYGNYFRHFKTYLLHVGGPKKPLIILNDTSLYRKFGEALLRKNPRCTYKNEPWKYFFYYNALRISPFWLQSYLVKKFMRFPQFKGN